MLVNTATRHKLTGAFTLIELLVVMGVMAILVSLIVPVIGRLRRQAHIASVQATIDSLSSALEKYKVAHLRYPPDRHPSLTRSSQCLVYYLSGASIYDDSANPWTHDLYKDSNRGDIEYIEQFPVYHDFAQQLLKGFSEVGGVAPGLIDPWQSTIIYNSGSSSNGPYNRYNSAKHGERKFDLFSAGPDGEYGSDDDITNWQDTLPWGYDEDGDDNPINLKDGTH